jgi:hypothetical protein
MNSRMPWFSSRTTPRTSKNLRPAKRKPFREQDDEGGGPLRMKQPHLLMEQGNPQKNWWLVTTVWSIGATMEELEHGLHSRATRKRRIQRSMGSGRSPNTVVTLSTLSSNSRWKEAGRNVCERSVQTIWTAQNNSIQSRAIIPFRILETHLQEIWNWTKAVNRTSSSDRRPNWNSKCSNGTISPKLCQSPAEQLRPMVTMGRVRS